LILSLTMPQPGLAQARPPPPSICHSLFHPARLNTFELTRNSAFYTFTLPAVRFCLQLPHRQNFDVRYDIGKTALLFDIRPSVRTPIPILTARLLPSFLSSLSPKTGPPKFVSCHIPQYYFFFPCNPVLQNLQGGLPCAPVVPSPPYVS